MFYAFLSDQKKKLYLCDFKTILTMTPPTVASPIAFDKGILTPEELLRLYKLILYPRLIEEKMALLLRQGKVSKWFSGVGQEAISVGCAAALKADETIFTMHRNLGVFTTREVPLKKMFDQWQGKPNGFTKGRDRSFHFGAPDHHIVGMISHLGPQLSLAAGVALAHKIKKEGRVSLAFTGEGGTSEGEFHEALNVAAVWDLPVIFVVENNGYALSTPVSEQFRCASIADKGVGYGMEALSVDGNNLLEVYQTVARIASEMRERPHPVLLECRTFRMRGHEEASGTKYVPSDLSSAWAAKDPLDKYERFILEEGILTEQEIVQIKETLRKQINRDSDASFQEPAVWDHTPESELADVYAPFQQLVKQPPADSPGRVRRLVDAVSDGLLASMRRHPNLILMGQDIAEYGGVFKITEGFLKEFGEDRVRNTPLCESAIVGIALGLSLRGMKAMVEMQFADFVTCGFNQIINNLAKLHYRWGGTADVVIRMPAGGGVGAGPFHSQTNEAWFAHTPGLKVLYPSNPFDAKGLLIAAFEDPNPVIYFEHKALYRSLSAEIPDAYYTVEIGKAAIVRPGSALTIITYGAGVQWALKTTEDLQIDAEVVDLRTLSPIDYSTIEESVKKTNKVVILHEDTLFGGLGGELSAYISEHLFEYLDAPVLRVASLDTPVPFSPVLEKQFLAVERLESALKKLIKY